jgi:hypothetical protein
MPREGDGATYQGLPLFDLKLLGGDMWPDFDRHDAWVLLGARLGWWLCRVHRQPCWPWKRLHRRPELARSRSVTVAPRRSTGAAQRGLAGPTSRCAVPAVLAHHSNFSRPSVRRPEKKTSHHIQLPGRVVVCRLVLRPLFSRGWPARHQRDLSNLVASDSRTSRGQH